MRPRRRPSAALWIVVAAIAGAACSDDDSSTGSGTTTPITTPSTMPAPPEATLPLAELEAPSDVPLEEHVTPAMGGMRFSASTEHFPAILHDTVLVYTEPPDDVFIGPRSAAEVALITQSVAGSPIANVESFLDTVAGVDSAVIEPTGDAIDLFGRRLIGYEIRDTSATPTSLFSSARYGAPVDSEFSPLPYSILYLADTPAGVLTAGISGADEEHARRSAGALATLIATAELTGPGLDGALPPGEVITPTDGGGPRPAPAPLADDGPPAMEVSFAAIEPGRYQLPNVGRELTIDVEDGWYAQPNLPGFVVLTGPNSIGPGDRDLVLFSDVVEYLPTEAGPRRAGAAVAVTDVDDFIAAPPPGFTVSDVVDDQLGQASVTRFDLTTDPDATCGLGDPCEASLVTSYDVVKPLTSGFDHRIWWITHDEGPHTVFVAMALGDRDFIERATALVDTVEFA